MVEQLFKLFPELSKNLKLGWLIIGNLDVAGSRLHGWAMHNYFSQNGFTSYVNWASSGYKPNLKFTKKEIDEIFEVDINVIMLQGVKSISLEDYFFSQCAKYDVKTILIDTDNINLNLGQRCDAVITISDYIKSLFSEDMQDNVFVVVDHYDHDGSNIKVQTTEKELKMCFLSNNVFSKFPGVESLPENTQLKIIGPSKKRVKKYTPKKKMFTETPFAFDYVIWTLDTVEEDILDCDIALIPYPIESIDAEYIKRKSNNRLILFMSYGLPCIVSPVKPYLETIRHGENGFFAKTSDEWEKYITLLRDDPILREKIATTARAEVMEKYSVHTQASQYLEVVSAVLKK